MAQSGVGKLWKPVVNVTDMDEGERFWSAVSGLSPVGRHGDGVSMYASLEPDDPASTEPWMLLQCAPEGQSHGRGGTHLDFRVDDVAQAMQEIETLGGKTLKPPAFYGDVEDAPYLEWAIMQDPFGNDFCIIRYPL
ncbi:MAG: VOC family protein [Mycobacteriales bacterium]